MTSWLTRTIDMFLNGFRIFSSGPTVSLFSMFISHQQWFNHIFDLKAIQKLIYASCSSQMTNRMLGSHTSFSRICGVSLRYQARSLAFLVHGMPSKYWGDYANISSSHISALTWASLSSSIISVLQCISISSFSDHHRRTFFLLCCLVTSWSPSRTCISVSPEPRWIHQMVIFTLYYLIQIVLRSYLASCKPWWVMMPTLIFSSLLPGLPELLKSLIFLPNILIGIMECSVFTSLYSHEIHPKFLKMRTILHPLLGEVMFLWALSHSKHAGNKASPWHWKKHQKSNLWYLLWTAHPMWIFCGHLDPWYFLSLVHQKTMRMRMKSRVNLRIQW